MESYIARCLSEEEYLKTKNSVDTYVKMIKVNQINSKQTGRLWIQRRYTGKKSIGKDCSVCRTDIGKRLVAHTPCGHVFHFQCLKQNVEARVGNSWYRCPNCRFNLLSCLRKLDFKSSTSDN